MLVALAVSDKDFLQAERLLRWMGFLSEQIGGNLKRERLILSVSKRATEEFDAERLVALSERIFDQVYSFVSDGPEIGWTSANWMFRSILVFIEHGHSAALFMEPDSVPVNQDWFPYLEFEYDIQGKPFMGGFVPTPPPHMTGVGVYPPNWRDYAPSLANVPDSAGWDTYCAGEVNPYCHYTPLIQHVFRRHEPNWSIPGLNALDKRAVIFHQDKHGKLIKLLDAALYGGACARHPIFGEQVAESESIVMTKFYHTVNSTKAIVTRGKRFLFTPIDAFAGSVPGVYATESATDQDLLADLTQNPTTGVTEISQQDWEKLSKKNWTHPVLRTLLPSNETWQQPTQFDPNKRVQAEISPTPSRQAAVVVAEPVSGVGDPSAPPGLATIKDIGEVLRVDTVTPSQPPPATAPKAKRAPLARKKEKG